MESPYGKVDRALGGAATYFAVAASFFTHVNLVGIVGDDFTEVDARIFSRAHYRYRRLGTCDGEDVFLGRALFPEFKRTRNTGNRTECICGIQAPPPRKIPRLTIRFPRQHRARFAARRASSSEEAAENCRAGYHELLDRAEQRGIARDPEAC